MKLSELLLELMVDAEVNVDDKIKLDNRDGIYKVVKVDGNIVRAKHPKTKDIVVFTKRSIEKVIR